MPNKIHTHPYQKKLRTVLLDSLNDLYTERRKLLKECSICDTIGVDLLVRMEENDKSLQLVLKLFAI